ncbi:MAG: hypothetical protein BJ554DRAFT_4986 [Olpidium bornovanus]|uniref:Uncharacterized protein n=1 Tax=Olpidium bornovanus TaxID=278681 RepID=A0A8H7ZK18_9FUNG|nr:MAG: hypothetical protein BJ554DRAFT_4986 [Olpidium bornovanus]
MEAYVLLGKGVPEGRTAYVLAKEPPAISKPETWMLINPVTGDCYGQTDAHCPLREIGCVFNSKNIWLNVHAYADPARVNFFGITRSRAEWHPFFDKFGNAEPAATVQVRDLAYREVALKVLKELERQIDRTLTAKIEQWRGRHTTKWNRLCSKTFAGLLTYFEPAVTVARPPSYSYSPTTVTTAASSSYGAAAVAGDTAAEEAHYRELQRLRGAYRVAGFPLHQSFTDVDSVVEAVHATDVFSVEDPQAEFALAVACNGYPCDVVSVWVYVASLTPLKHVRW